MRRYNEGKTGRNVAVMAEHTGFEEDFLRQICWTSLREDGMINLQSVLDFQSWTAQRGHTKGTVPVDRIWDPRFVEHANGILRAGKP